MAGGAAGSGIGEDGGNIGNRRAGASVGEDDGEDDDGGGGDCFDDDASGGGGDGVDTAAGPAAATVASVVAAGVAAGATEAVGETRGTAMGGTHPSTPVRFPHTGDLLRGNERLPAAETDAVGENAAVAWETRGTLTPGVRLPVVAAVVARLSIDGDPLPFRGEHSVALLRDGVSPTDTAVWGWGGVWVDGEVIIAETSPPRRRLGMAVPLRGCPRWDGVDGGGRSRAKVDPSSRRTDEGIVLVSLPAPPAPAAAPPSPPPPAPPLPPLPPSTPPSLSPLRPLLLPPRRMRLLETPRRGDNPSGGCCSGTVVRTPAKGATPRRRGMSDGDTAAGGAAAANPTVVSLGVVAGVASAPTVAVNVAMRGTAAGGVTRPPEAPEGVCEGGGGGAGSDGDNQGRSPGGGVVGTPVDAPPGVPSGVPLGVAFGVSCGWQVPAGSPIS